MYESFLQTKVFRGLDGLRFLSIFGVVWHHATARSDQYNILNLGFLGVDLFFVISGFLIVSLLLREKSKTQTISLKQFYIRRALRIFPLYYAVIIGLAILYWLAAPDSEFGQRYLSELPIYLFYLANFYPVAFGIMWSLATEEQFYLVWPFIEKTLTKFVYPILAVALVINQVLNFNHVAITQWLGVHNHEIFQITFTPILLGALLAHLLHDKTTFNKVAIAIRHRWASVAWAALLFVLLWFANDNISGLPRLSIQVCMMFLVGAVVVNGHAKLLPLLEFKPVARIGIISYGVYIFHIHGIVIGAKISDQLLGEANNSLIVFILSFAITIVVAELSYRFFEKHFLRLKSKYSVIHQKHA